LSGVMVMGRNRNGQEGGKVRDLRSNKDISAKKKKIFERKIRET